jgi:hypothetical protein
MMFGGNGKLRQFFKSYGMPEDAPIDFKYRTRAGQYYRDQVSLLIKIVCRGAYPITLFLVEISC